MAHVIPKDDDFDITSLALPDYYSGYIACDAFSDSLLFGSAITTATIVTHEAVCLTDAYSPSAASRVAVMSAGDHSPSGESGGFLSMMLRRDTISNADAFKVMLPVQVVHVNGTSVASNNVPAHIYVCARVSGMAAANLSGGSAPSWGDEYYLSGTTGTPITGYFFGSSSSVGGGSRFYLVRIVSNAVTTLAETIFSDVAESSGNTYDDLFGDKTTPHWYRMTFASDGAGGLDITCEVGGPGVSGASATIFNAVNDPVGSTITTAGRSGWMCQGEVTEVGGVNKWYLQVPYFRIDINGTATVLDRWERRQKEDSRLAQSALHTATVGYDLRSNWTGDALGKHDFGSGSVGPWLQKGPGGFPDRARHLPTTVSIGSSTDTWREGYSLSQRHSTEPNTHHREVRARFVTAATPPTSTERRWVGVVVRAGTGAAEGNVPFGGYLFQVSTDDGGTFAGPRLELWRIASDGLSAVLIAEDTTTPILVDTNYDVDLQVYNIDDAGGNPDSIVVIRAALNSSVLTWGLTTAAITAGFTDGGSGTLFDNTSEAIRISTGEGFRIASYAAAGEDGVTLVDNWTEGTLDGTVPDSDDEQDQASISIAGETDDDTTQTLTLPAHWVAEETITSPADVFEFETGHVRRGPKFQDERRRWTVYVSAATTAERDTLVTFWDDHDGIEKAFSWTPPHETTALKVHFATDTLRSLLLAPGVYTFRFDLEQLL